MSSTSAIQQSLRDVNKQVSDFADKQPKTMRAYSALRGAVLEGGALDVKTKELIALAIAVVDQCDGCIAFHVDHASEAGASSEEIEEALSVAILMGGGPALVYATHALEAVQAIGAMNDSEPLPRYFD